MSGHTPGPWRVRTHEEGGEVVGCFVAANDVNGYPYDAQIMGDDEYRGAPGRELADAHLISAAPEMLEALRFAREWIIEHREVGKNAMTLGAINAAIKKAEGRS